MWLSALALSFLVFLSLAEDTTVCRPCTEHDPNCGYPGQADQTFCDHCAEAEEGDTFCPDGYCDCTTYDENGRPSITYPDMVCRACTADDEGCLVGIATDTWCAGQCSEDAVGGQCFKEYCVCETCDKQLTLKTKDGQGNYGGCAGTYKKTAMEHCGVEEFYSDAQNRILRYFSKNEGGSSFYADKWYCSAGSGYSDTCSSVSGAFHRSTNTGDNVDESLWTSYTVEDVESKCDQKDLPSQSSFMKASAKEGEETVCRPCEEGEPECAYPGNADQAFCDRCAADMDNCASGYCECTHFNPDGKPDVSFPTEVCRACTADDEGCLVGIATDTWCAGQCAPSAAGGQCFKEYCVCETCDSTLTLAKKGTENYAACAGEYRRTTEDCDAGLYYSESHNRVLRHMPADATGHGTWEPDRWFCEPGSGYIGDCDNTWGGYYQASTNLAGDVSKSEWSQYEIKDFVDSCSARDLPSQSSFMKASAKEGETTVCRPCEEGEPNCAYPGNADQAFCDRCAADMDSCASGYCECTHFNPDGKPAVDFPTEVCRACTADDEGCKVGIATDTWCAGQCAPDAVGGQCFKEYCVCETCDTTLTLAKKGTADYASCAGEYRKTSEDCEIGIYYSESQNKVLLHFPADKTGYGTWYPDRWFLEPGSGYTGECNNFGQGYYQASTNKGEDVAKSEWSQYEVKDFMSSCPARELPSESGASRSTHSTSSQSGPDHTIDKEYHMKEVDTDLEWSREETWDRKEWRRKRAEAERAVSGNFIAADATPGTSLVVKGFAFVGFISLVYGAFQFYCSSSPKTQGFSAIP